MKKPQSVFLLLAFSWIAQAEGPFPGPTDEGYLLPNGWTLTPIGKQIQTEDQILNLVLSPDGKVAVALTCGFNPHGLVVIDTQTEEAIQRIPQKTAWFGMAWHPDGKRLYVSGGNTKKKGDPAAPVYVYGYAEGKLSETASTTLSVELPKEKVFWSGLVHHPSKPILYALNRMTNEVVLFDTDQGKVIGTWPTEQSPYDLVLSPDGEDLYVSNWGSDTVSHFKTAEGRLNSVMRVGDNPCDLILTRNGRLFVCCSNENRVVIIDTRRGRPVETLITSLYERAPEGSTPNALALDPKEETLFITNADNNNIAVADVEETGEGTVLGFIPVGWYPSALAVSADGSKLFVGNSKGVASYSNVDGPHSPKARETGKTVTTKSGQKGAVSIIDASRCRQNMLELTRQVYKNCPYRDELLVLAPEVDEKTTIVPRRVGAGSPIKHVIYIIKENRTYDQVLGDLPQGKGDPELCLFGREITPNIHNLVETYVLFDNLYCDAEVSVDGHQWSNAAYATDYTEKNWPAEYGGWSDSPRSFAIYPSSGYLWDQCAHKGLTYRTYGEFAERQSEDGIMTPIHPSLGALHGHVAPHYLSWGARDTENAREFIREFDEYEKNYDSTDPGKRLPNFIVMALPEDHTHGTQPGAHTPRACVASNDYALGMIVERVSRSRYWPQTAIFVIQDDAQDGPDHIDARRTEGLVISPYSLQGIVDSTLYTTSSMLRTIELLLGLQPMSQFDAAANPMYKALGVNPNIKPYEVIPPKIDLNETNTKTAWGAEASMQMDFSSYDRTPMFELNEIIWKSVKGADSEMPLPVHRFQAAVALRN